MKLIIERTERGAHAYVESESHHRYVERTKQRRHKVSLKVLSDECHLETALAIGDYIVVALPTTYRGGK